MDSITFEMDAAALHRLIYNGRLFGRDSDIYLVAGPLVAGPRSGIKMRSWDGHVFLTDVADAAIPDKEMIPFALGPQAHRELEMVLRTHEGPMKVLVEYEGDQTGYVSIPDHSFPFTRIDVTKFDLTDSLLNEEYWRSSGEVTPFALNPDRFRKFSLVKPGGYPMDFFRVWHTEISRHLLLFKAGPSVRGAYIELDRNLLGEGPHLW